ncbi:MAG: O-antigen ligase family protein [Deltaproteobacteria bacterium]|nr:O-antigen ligase family protein [Deltaproteobacteria bacterium]
MSELALAAALAVPLIAALGVGGIDPLSHTVLASIALGALALTVAARRRAGAPLRVTWLAAPFALALVGSAAMLTPLPHALRRMLAPESAERALRAAELVGPEAAHLVRPVLAFDPPGAGLALVRGLCALALVVVVAQTASRRAQRRRAYQLLTGAGAVLLVVAVGHAVLGVERAWGIVGEGAHALLHAPFVNPNHLGKVLAFFAVLAVGRALSIRRGPEIAWHGVVGGLCALGVVFTDSRGALLALLAGSAVLAVLLLARRTERSLPNAPRVLGMLAAALVVGAAFASTVGAELVSGLARFDPEGASKSKVVLWPAAWRLVREHWLVGVGPDAFGAVFPSTLAVGELKSSSFVYTHVENLVLQVLVDRGLPLGLLLVAMAAIAAWYVARSGAALLAPAASAAVATLLVGDVFDFLLDLPVGIALCAVGLGLVAARAKERLPALELHWRRAALACGGLALLCGLALPVALFDWRRHVDRALDELEGDAQRAQLVRAVARHPSDGQYPYEMAVAARHRRDPRGALRAAERALTLWPAHRTAHVEVARALAALGREEQALLEYRVAWRCGPFDEALQREILGRYPDYQRRRRAVPDVAASLAHLCSAVSAPADVQRCLDDLAALPDATAAQRGAPIMFALTNGDVDGAVARAEAVMREASPDGAAAAAAAQALARKDGVAAALARTASWSARVDDAVALLSWRVGAAAEVGDEAAVDAALAELRSRARTPAALDAADRVLAGVHERRGDAAAAHRIVERLAGRAPTDVSLGVWQARLERTLGMHAQALATARRLQRAFPDDARVKALASELEGGARR